MIGDFFSAKSDANGEEKMYDYWQLKKESEKNTKTIFQNHTDPQDIEIL